MGAVFVTILYKYRLHHICESHTIGTVDSNNASTETHKREDSVMSTMVEKLIAAGGSEWIKGDMHRIYFNDLPGLYGLSVSKYNTGNISSASLNGEGISNSKAYKLIDRLSGKLWYDAKTEQFASRDLRPDDVAVLVDAIKSRVA